MQMIIAKTCRSAIAIGLAIGLALLLASPAAAHAELVRSNPPAGATLDASPPSIELEFSEALDPNFSQVQLVDSQGKVIEPGPGEVQPDAPRTLRLIVPDLPKGSYAAIWRVRSAADGHITEGNLPFGVGVPAAGSSLIPPIGAPDPATVPPPIPDTLARWLNLVAAALALGALPFAVLVWRPAYRRATDDRRPTNGDQGSTSGAPQSDDGRPTTDDNLTGDGRRATSEQVESLELSDVRLAAGAGLQASRPKPQA